MKARKVKDADAIVYEFGGCTPTEVKFLNFLLEAMGPRSRTTAEACEFAAQMLNERAAMILHSDEWDDEE